MMRRSYQIENREEVVNVLDKSFGGFGIGSCFGWLCN